MTILNTGFYSEETEDGGDWHVIKGPINALSATLKFPNLKTFDTLQAEDVTILEIENVENLGSIFASRVKTLHLPNLLSSRGSIGAGACRTIFAPKLTSVVGNISIQGTEGVELSSLEEAQDIHITPFSNSIEQINLPALRKAREISLRDVLEFRAENITELKMGILGTKLQTLKIPKVISLTKVWTNDELLGHLRADRKQSK